MFLVIDDWDEKILGYCVNKDTAEKIAEINEYCTNHSTYVHECNEVSEAVLPEKLYACVHHYKYGDTINTYIDPSDDIKKVCETNEVEYSNEDKMPSCYIYFTIGTKPNESREELEERILSKTFLILKEKGIR